MAGTATTTARNVPAWPKDALRIGFGIIWLIDAILKWLPGFRADYMGTIMAQAQAQPGWLRGWFDFWINLQHPQAAFFAYLVAVAETLIALALIAGFARKLTYISATALSLLIWATAEGFGGPYTSGAADIGTALIYAVVFAGLLALSYYAGPARYSADYYLEQKFSWWWRLAEVRRPARAEQAPAAPASTAELAAGPPVVVPQRRTSEPAAAQSAGRRPA
jgi:nitrite reductase (NO-forming)